MLNSSILAALKYSISTFVSLRLLVALVANTYSFELFQNEICVINVITCKIILTEIGLLLINGWSTVSNNN